MACGAIRNRPSFIHMHDTRLRQAQQIIGAEKACRSAADHGDPKWFLTGISGITMSMYRGIHHIKQCKKERKKQKIL
jgi:hypothetical protein